MNANIAFNDVSIIKNIEQEVTNEVDSNNKRENFEIDKSPIEQKDIDVDASLAGFFNNILDKMNSNNNVLPDAKELQKAVIGKLFIR